MPPPHVVDELADHFQLLLLFFFFNDTAPTEIYTVMNTLSLHDALPISVGAWIRWSSPTRSVVARTRYAARSEEHTSELQSLITISYAVFCLKKKNFTQRIRFPVSSREIGSGARRVGARGLRVLPERFFFFNDTATTEIYTVMNTLSLHDALPISMATSHNASPGRENCNTRAA